MRSKFSSKAFAFERNDTINGEWYRRADGTRVLVWYDTNTRLWAVYAADDNDYQISREAEYVVRSDVAWAIENCDTEGWS